MVLHNGILLAVDIITTSFGNVVGKVCNCLLEKGALTMQDLARFTKLKLSQLKNTLLVLIQHNCVQAFTRSTDGKCENIMRVLLEHGRLTFDQLMTRGVWMSNEEVLDGADAKDMVRSNIVKLAQAHFLERCPNPKPSLVSSPDTNPKKKFARGVKAMEEIVTDEQLAVAAATCLDSHRFYFPTQVVGASEVMEDEEPNAKEVGQKLSVVSSFTCSFPNISYCFSAPLSIDAILQVVREHSDGLAMTREHVRAALDQIGFVSCSGGIEETYCINLRNIIEAARNDEVESIVLKRYGRDSYKIFRLLSMKGCSCDAKESMKHPQGQSQWLCFWKVNRNILWEHVLDDVYHAAVNLSQRLAFEIKQEREITKLVKNQMASGAQITKLTKMKRIIHVIEASVLKVDDSLMLFHDF
ncbi:unnamed protein product [Victoria cruziana]